jgi:hypothetical protein
MKIIPNSSETQRWFALAGLILVLLVVLNGCRKSKEKSDVQREGDTSNFVSKAEGVDEDVDKVLGRSAILKGKVYIDSVPRGAHVYLVRADANDDKEVGITPLTLEPSECPEMKFWIMMTVDEYVSKMKNLPGMEEWLEDFQTQNHFGGLGTTSGFFDFDTSVTYTGVDPDTNSLLLFGPVYELEWPMMNRVCAFFIPVGKNVSDFFPLMPPKGTFSELKGEWHKNMLSKYKFTEEQADEAIECFPRCGKYIARVKNPYKEGWAMEYSITAQGPECPLTYISQREVRD